MLHERVDRWLEGARDLRATSPAHMSEVAEPAPLTNTEADPILRSLAQVDAPIGQRVLALTNNAIANRPRWLRPLVVDAICREDPAAWRRQVSRIAAYRDLNEIDGPASKATDQDSDDQ